MRPRCEASCTQRACYTTRCCPARRGRHSRRCGPQLPHRLHRCAARHTAPAPSRVPLPHSPTAGAGAQGARGGVATRRVRGRERVAGALLGVQLRGGAARSYRTEQLRSSQRGDGRADGAAQKSGAAGAVHPVGAVGSLRDGCRLRLRLRNRLLRRAAAAAGVGAATGCCCARWAEGRAGGGRGGGERGAVRVGGDARQPAGQPVARQLPAGRGSRRVAAAAEECG
jgi:hypothetical protein